MKTRITVALVLCGVLALGALSGSAQTKLAQTGMKFLSVGTDARYAALGDGMTAVEGSPTAMFYNAAGIARLTSFANVGLGLTEFIHDFKQYYGAVSFAPGEGQYGVIGVSFQVADYGEFEGTIIAGTSLPANEKGYYDNSDYPGLNFKPGSYNIGLTYARALTDKFSIGATVKYVVQDLGTVTVVPGEPTYDNENSVVAFDFGLIYRTGFKSLNFGMTIRNFSREVKYVNEGFQLPLTFRLGVSMDVFDLTEFDPEMHSLLVILDAEHPRDFPEQVRFGLEYTFLKLFALRFGYVNPSDESTFSYGAGVRWGQGSLGVGLDYAFTPYGVFGDVHRFTFQFSL